MNDMRFNWDDVYPESTRSDLDDPESFYQENEQHCQVIKTFKFHTNFTNDSENYGTNFYSGINIVTKEEVVLNKFLLKNESEKLHIKNKLKQYYDLQNRNITCVLQIFSDEDQDNHMYIFYKSYNCTLRNYIKTEHITECDFKYLLKKLFKAIDLLHLENIVLGNISLDNIAMVNENRKLMPKLFNLWTAKHSTNSLEQTKDKRDVGVLLLAIFVGDQQARIIAEEFQNRRTRDEKFDLIYDKVKNVDWISRTNIKNFADLIACLLNVKPSDHLTKFTNHAFFYIREKTLEFLSAANGRLNLSQDDRSKNSPKGEDVKNRNKVLNKIMPGSPEIHTKLKELLGVFAPKDATLAERAREARNKEVHLEDDTDNECETEDNDGCKTACENNCNNDDDTKSIQSVDYRNESTNCGQYKEAKNGNDCKNKTKANPKKDPEAWKKMSRFLYKKGGAINVHLEADENFIYDLFNSIRILAFNPNIKRFYIDSFLFEDPQSRYNEVLNEILTTESKAKEEDAINEGTLNAKGKAPPIKVPSRSSNDTNTKLRTQAMINESKKKQSQKEDKNKMYAGEPSNQQTRESWHESLNRSQSNLVHEQPVNHNQFNPKQIQSIQMNNPANRFTDRQQRSHAQHNNQQPTNFRQQNPGPCHFAPNSNEFIPGRREHNSHATYQNQNVNNKQQSSNQQQFPGGISQPNAGSSQYNFNHIPAAANQSANMNGYLQRSNTGRRNEFIAKHNRW